jgi:hypothetical protein
VPLALDHHQGLCGAQGASCWRRCLHTAAASLPAAPPPPPTTTHHHLHAELLRTKASFLPAAGNHWTALVHYAMLAEQGHAPAMANAAHMLIMAQGYNGSDRLHMARDLLERAALINCSSCAVQLGHLLMAHPELFQPGSPGLHSLLQPPQDPKAEGRARQGLRRAQPLPAEEAPVKRKLFIPPAEVAGGSGPGGGAAAGGAGGEAVAGAGAIGSKQCESGTCPAEPSPEQQQQAAGSDASDAQSAGQHSTPPLSTSGEQGTAAAPGTPPGALATHAYAPKPADASGAPGNSSTPDQLATSNTTVKFMIGNYTLNADIGPPLANVTTPEQAALMWFR